MLNTNTTYSCAIVSLSPSGIIMYQPKCDAGLAISSVLLFDLDFF